MIKEYVVTTKLLEQIAENFLGLRQEVRNEIEFLEQLLPKDPKKMMPFTTSWVEDGLLLYMGTQLISFIPAYAYNSPDRSDIHPIGTVFLPKVKIFPVAEITDVHAKETGYRNRQAWIDSISKTHDHEMNGRDYFCRYEIKSFIPKKG